MPKDVKLVIGSGAGGGLVSWAFTLMTGATFGLDMWVALPLCVILGTAAALVAVYVVTPTDVSKTGRLIGFAVLCGFLWKPVLDAGRIVINQRIEAAQTSAELKVQLGQLKTATSAPASAGTNAQEVGSQASELLLTSDRLGNSRLEKQATEQATEAIGVIADSAKVDPAAAAFALEEIKKAAESSDNPELVGLAGAALRDLAPRTPPPGVQ